MRRARGSWVIAMVGALAVVLAISGAAFALGGGSSAESDRSVAPANVELEGEAAEDRGPSDPPDDTHGACVAAVAESDAVGGKNENHGGAVSEAARFTCRGLEPDQADARGKGQPPWAGGAGGPPWADEGRPPWAGEGRPPWAGNGPPPWANDSAGRDADE
jgi:hypothetical protein